MGTEFFHAVGRTDSISRSWLLYTQPAVTLRILGFHPHIASKFSAIEQRHQLLGLHNLYDSGMK